MTFGGRQGGIALLAVVILISASMLVYIQQQELMSYFLLYYKHPLPTSTGLLPTSQVAQAKMKQFQKDEYDLNSNDDTPQQQQRIVPPTTTSTKDATVTQESSIPSRTVNATKKVAGKVSERTPKSSPPADAATKPPPLTAAASAKSVTAASASTLLRNDDSDAAFQALRIKYDNATTIGDNTTQLFQRLHQQHGKVFHFNEEGRAMMDTYIMQQQQKSTVTILEIGVWFGHSTARWLQLGNNNVRVIGIDPFTAPSKSHKKLSGIPASDRNYFGKPWFNKALAHYLMDAKVSNSRNRTILVTGLYPNAATTSMILNHDAKVNIDILYIDGGKTSDAVGHCQFINDTIVGFLHAFPNALVSGDDWKHGTYNNPLPFQETVKQLARTFNRTLYVAGERTWIMAQQQQLSEEVTRLGKRLV
jgi:hypothetical protein